MDRAGIDAGLGAALLTDDEVALGMRRWRRLPDPFEPWAMSEPEEAEAPAPVGADGEGPSAQA
jgi:hypothetical protein